jgi:hypothetical protein
MQHLQVKSEMHRNVATLINYPHNNYTGKRYQFASEIPAHVQENLSQSPTSFYSLEGRTTGESTRQSWFQKMPKYCGTQ